MLVKRVVGKALFNLRPDEDGADVSAAVVGIVLERLIKGDDK